MEVKATLRYLSIAPRKVRLAAAVVRGMEVARAERQLTHLTKRAAPVLLKLLRSAAANARHNFHREDRDLQVKDIRINAGPTTSRYRARAFGRAASITRRTSHISLVLETMGSGVLAARGREKAEMAVRKATAEDVGGFSSHHGRAGVAEKIPTKKKSPGFMPRLFQRKVI